ncbi:wiskott-Aldrich syndrome protein-like [Megalops cyprinoides]|uniref:wiskott-Aldrich syndrome protein-like n=1 Tax=Megalops cyprinoides TaxID=118141 RepID=UPI00186486DB|nr:wiskott-Aldrich syndrome protein-like [Megalops cyprinoides]
MSPCSKSKTQENSLSVLLSSEENERLVELLGRRRLTLATAVVQLYMSLPHSPSLWSLQHAGVVCFIKDSQHRSYFIRLYDIKEEKQIWEQELYDQMIYCSPQPYFHTFAADDCQVGLNFSSEQEAEAFKNTMEETIRQRANRQDRRRLPPPPPADGPALYPGTLVTVNIPNPDIRALHYQPAAVPTPAPACISKIKNDKKTKNRPKLTKADIGAPCGFKHVTHIGWDSNTGFDTNNLDPDLKKLFSCAGISEDQLTDAKTSKIIYDVIEKSGGLEAVKEEMRKQDSTLLPLHSDQPAPNHGTLPPQHLHQHLSMAAPPPPPPPPAPIPSNADYPAGQGALLDQIRLGKKLKNVTESPDSQAPVQVECSEGIVGALMMVMQKRSKVIHSSDEEDGDKGDDEDDEWDD